MSADVMIVGSLSMDLVLQVPRLPKIGETLSGSTFNTFVGGKGNNQALAAARAGAKTGMLGKLGGDAYGEVVLANLKDNGVDCSTMLVDKSVATGIANIWVSPNGDNSIIIVANSNGLLSVQDVDNAADKISAARVLLLQLEVPMETVTRAARVARQNNSLVILNPAPAPPSGQLPEDLLQHVDILVPNETEAEILTGIKPVDNTSTEECIQKLLSMGPRAVILTLGERGAIYVSQSERHKVNAFNVKVVDSTAAGDAFCGALASRLAAGDTMEVAMRYGCAAGSLACTKSGAGPSLPYAAQLEEMVNSKV